MTTEVNTQMALDHGLNNEEWEQIEARLGRTPTYTELGVLSVMWSEHCSYKSSRLHLAKQHTHGDHRRGLLANRARPRFRPVNSDSFSLPDAITPKHQISTKGVMMAEGARETVEGG